MNYLSMLKNAIPYSLILGVILYIYFQDNQIENLKLEREFDKQEITTLKENSIKREEIFNDRLKKVEAKAKFLEQKSNIEKGFKKDEKDITKSIPNRFYISN